MPVPPPIGYSSRARGGPGWLLRRYAERRDPRDLEELTRRFRPLARRLAQRYARDGEALDDLEQVAALGLVKALQRFDPARGYAFTTFAVPTILGEIKRSFRDTGWVAHVPRAIQERAAKVRDAGRALQARDGRAPTVGAVAERVGCTEEEVVDALVARGALSSVSLDAPRADGETPTLAEGLGEADRGYERVEDEWALAAALPTLTPFQRTVVMLRFGADLKQSEIAERMHCSQMQISRTLRASIERLQLVVQEQSRPPAPLAA